MSEFLSPWIKDAPAFALTVGLAAIAICLLVLAADGLLRRRSMVARHRVLLTGVLVLLALPVLVGIGFYLPSTSIWPTMPAQEEIVKVSAQRWVELVDDPADAWPVGTPVAEEVPAEADAVWNFEALIGPTLVGLWALGALVGLSRFLLALGRAHRAVIGKPWRAGFWTEDVQAHLARHVGLSKFPPVHISPLAPMPMVDGVWRPVIVLPEQAPASWGQMQWEAILLHEAAHIARRDPWAVLAQRLAVSLYWWCPLIFVLSRRLGALRESICDEHALAGSCDPIGYAEILVESAERLLSLKAVPVPLALLDSAQRGLEARVTRLLAKERKPMTQLSRLAKCVGAFVLGAVCLVTVTATAFAQAQPEKKIQIKIIVDGKEVDLSDPRVWDRLQTVPKKADERTGKYVESYIELVNPEPANPGTPARVRVETYPATPVEAIRYRALVQDEIRSIQTADPRIEELVKQAEAIKPGSGAAIRKALQAMPKKADTVEKGAVHALTITGDGKQLATSSQDKAIKLWSSTTGKAIAATAQTPGGKRIILIIEDGKVTQLQEPEAKALGIRLDGAKTPGKLPASGDTKKEAGQPMTTSGSTTTSGTTNSPYRTMTSSPMPDLEALRRQIERISAELNSLKSRLDAPAK